MSEKSGEKDDAPGGRGGRLSKETLDKVLQGFDNVPEFWNDKLLFALKNKKITETQLQCSAATKEHVIKRYLHGMTEKKVVRDRIKSYAILCTKLYRRATALLNLTVCENINNDTNLLKICDILSSSMKIKPIVLCLRDPLPELFQKCLTKHKFIDSLGPSTDELSLVSHWSNVKTYIANKIHANMKTQIKTHFLKRLKTYVRAQAKGPPDEAVKYLFGESPCDNVEDRTLVENIVDRLAKGGLLKDGLPELPAESLPSSLIKFHFDLCKASEKGFRPLPFPSVGARHHGRIDPGVFSTLMRDHPDDERDMHVELKLARELWNSKKNRVIGYKKRQRVKTVKKRTGKNKKTGKTKRSKKVRRYNRLKVRKLKNTQWVSSIESDGVAVSIVIKTLLKPAREKKDIEQYHEEQMRKIRDIYKNESPSITAFDPGHVYLLTGATIPQQEINLEAPKGEVVSCAKHSAFSRAQWGKICRQQEQRAWEEDRRSNVQVKKALDRLTDSGGGRSCNAETWANFVKASAEGIEVLDEEFLLNDDRCKRRFTCFRRKQAALMKVAGFAIQKDEKTPILIGIGNANVSATMKGCPISVPTKEIQKSIKRAFKQHNKKGYIMKVWEHRTTKTCYKCFNDMETMYKEDKDGKQVPDREFRRCNHCKFRLDDQGAERPKERNRDFNAAKNILLAFIAVLEDKPRPQHLCCVKRTDSAVMKARKKTLKKSRKKAL